MMASTLKSDSIQQECETIPSCSGSDYAMGFLKENTPSENEDFVWDEYLDETCSVAAAPTSFIHVEQSLQSCVTEDMKLEVPNKQNQGAYWLASIVMTCGPLLRLRYEGYGEDRSADFWCDIATSEVHPVGWCTKNKKHLAPPEVICNKFEDWSQVIAAALIGATTVPEYLLKAVGTTPVDLIKQGMKIEIQEKLNPTCVWIATILENVGGRLLLRLEGAASTEDFWLFFLSHWLHPVGWATSNQYKYKPPDSIAANHTSEVWSKILQQALEDAKTLPLLEDIFKNQQKIRHHSFQEGMKLEAVNPATQVQFCPATVTKVLCSKYFLVQIDDHSVVDHELQVMCCHADSLDIFPVGWAETNGLKLMHPKGWLNYRQEFEWGEYLSYCKAEAAPETLFNLGLVEHTFEKGMKIEAVNPFQPNQICAATITKVLHQNLWVQLDSIDTFHANHIVPINSHDIFPVGWCESNHYPLKPPLNVQGRGRVMKKVAIIIPEKQKKKIGNDKVLSDVNAWCPKIFFNHRCFSGPYLSKGRIAELPRHVGPGPVTLVLCEVLSMVINVAYKSSKALQLLQQQGKANPAMQQCLLKAKYRGKSYRGMVEVVRSSDKVEDFCQQVCRKLECCEFLFGPKNVGERCPVQCSTMTKTKYVSQVPGKRKRKFAKVHVGESAAKLGRKRGRKPKGQVHIEAKENGDENSNSSGCKSNTSEGENKDLETGDAKRRKYVKYIAPKSDIVTRGAKLPSFALGLLRKRQRKSPPSSSEANTSPSTPTFSRESSEEKSEEPVEASVADQHLQDLQTTVCGHTQSAPLYPEAAIIPEELHLEKNPLLWTVDEVIQFIKGTDCASMARLLKDQDIDGQALLLLTLPTVQEHLDLKLGPAVKLCHHVERIKFAFYSQFAK